MDIAIRWFNKFETMIWWWWRWCLFLMDWTSEKQKKMVSVRNQDEDCELLSFSHFIQRQRCRYSVCIQFLLPTCYCNHSWSMWRGEVRNR
jgi:hypothetical protein